MTSNTNKNIPLNNKYTRTYYQKDSLVSNVRRALQRRIPSELFEASIQKHLKEDEKEFLLNYYIKRSDIDGDYYNLKSIPSKISLKTANQLLQEVTISEEDKNYLLKFYHFNEAEKKYILQEPLSEKDEIKMLKMFKRKSLHIGNSEKAMISKIMEQIEEIPKKDIFFANLYTPPDHEFFSPPNLKHISGMQIIESARQFGIACHHIFGKVPLDGVTFLLQNLNSEFYQYAKLNMPIKLRNVLKSVKFAKDGSWNQSKLEITIYQENTEISMITMEATILPLKVYKRLKEGQEEVYEIEPRYKLIEKFKKNISLRHANLKYICTIENFSLNGFMVASVGSPPVDFEASESIEFFMHFDIAGFIHGKCKLLWIRENDQNDDIFFSGYEITEISNLDMENLKESIARYGRLIEDREIL
ncbi:MAG: AfsA-related hotdog domain-containing protein [Leptospiraceae bacterium]|nr:AfsA-related hotdog domain-containing protein [Leptospiraceae bacterium]MCZ8347888.1 AfsA-related hotdog domain-containing protein [Leptospiraceae bacterium]